MSPQGVVSSKKTNDNPWIRVRGTVVFVLYHVHLMNSWANVSFWRSSGMCHHV